jgi:hypothetical protein
MMPQNITVARPEPFMKLIIKYLAHRALRTLKHGVYNQVSKHR